MSTPPPKPIRSPSYPSAGLGDAIANVRKIESAYRVSPVDREAAAKLIGYAGLSGPANQALASMAQFGLVERAGKGEMRVTPRARAILHPNSDDEKRRALREAALEPQLFQELQERWANMIPPEDGVVTYLNRQGFNQSAIKPAARAYLQTLHFLQEAGASESHGVAALADAESPASGSEIESVMEDQTSHTLQTFGASAQGAVLAIPKAAIMYESEREWLRGPLSRDTNYRLIVTGEMGPKQIAKLIKLLQAQQAVLEDDDDFSDIA